MDIREIGYEDVALLHVARYMALWPAVSKPVLPTFDFCSVFGFTEVGCNRGGVRVKSEAETRKKNKIFQPSY